jgi:PAS domain S-box-containing protein
MDIEDQLSNVLSHSPSSLPEKGELYRTLVRNFPNGAVLLFDRQLRYILADGVGLKEIGLSSQMLEGKTIWEIFPEEVCRVLEPRYLAALDGTQSDFEVAFAGRIYQVQTLPIHDHQGQISTGMVMTQDITARKNAEESLLKSQQSYEQLVNSIDGIVWEGDALTFQYFFVSKQAERLLGYPTERWINEPTFWQDHIHPEDRDWAVNYCALSTRKKKDHVFEYRMIAADGRVVWLRDIVTVVVENNAPVKLRGIMVNITENKKVETDLMEREQQYRSIFETVSDALFINRLEDGRLVDFNPAAAQMHGYTVEEFSRLQPADFIHPDSLDEFEEYIKIVRLGGIYQKRAVDVRKDGSTFHVEVLGTLFQYKGEPHSLAVVHNIDEQVKSYQTLAKRVEVRTHELQILLEVSRKVASTLDLNELLELIIEQMKLVVEFNSLRVWILEDQDTFILSKSHTLLQSERLMQRWNQPPQHRAILNLLDQQKPVIIPDVRVDSPLANIWREAVIQLEGAVPDFISSWMGVPLVVNNRVIGLLSFTHERHYYYKERHGDLALAIANHVAAAIENAKLYKKSQELAALQERQKLARELHDSVSQALYGIALGAGTARKLLEAETINREDLQKPIEYVLALAEAGLAEMRALIFELRPDSMQNEGLVAALSKQAESLEARHHIRVNLFLGEEPDLKLEVKQTLYRIAQEALHNIVKHARARQVEMRLTTEQGLVSLEIDDDGIGFDARGQFPGHLGLQSMRERAESLGGSFIIKSFAGKGTRINVQIPEKE